MSYSLLRSRPFIAGFCVCFLMFVVANVISVHYHSQFGLMAGLGLIETYDDVKGFGFPFLVWKAGGLSYDSYFSWMSLLANVTIAQATGLLVGLLFHSSFSKKGNPTVDSPT